VLFQDRRNTGRMDLEATEMAMRATLHGRVPRVEPTAAIPSSARGRAHAGLPLRPTSPLPRTAQQAVLTAVGLVEVLRPYYYAYTAGVGQFPADVELDIENTEFSPGVRRMQAVVGQEAPFDHGANR